MGVEAAAALADMAAAAGENKLEACRLGGVAALVGCIEQHGARAARAAEAGVSFAPLDCLVARLCLQACRALGNLCYGWDVDAVKVSAGPRAVAAIVRRCVHSCRQRWPYS